MRTKNNIVTLQDVARRAGVSSAAASYVLNNGPKIMGEETGRRVRAAAADLGYSGNLVAKSLATGRAWAIGVLVYHLDRMWAAQQLAGIEDAAQEAGYRVLIASHQQDPVRALTALGGMAASRLDGILSVSATASLHPEVGRHLSEVTLPVVYSFHEPAEGILADCVTIDHVQGGREAARHLFDMGCTKLAFIGGPVDHPVVRGRLEGFRAAHHERGLLLDERLIRFAPDFQVTDGLPVAAELLSGDILPDGVFTASDNLASAVVRVARIRGLRVPQDLAVIGFDNTAREITDPPLSTMRMPMVEMGKRSFALLQARIERAAAAAQDDAPFTPTTTRLPCSLIVRESSRRQIPSDQKTEEKP